MELEWYLNNFKYENRLYLSYRSVIYGWIIKKQFFFCSDLKKDPVASNVIKCCEEIMDLNQTDIVIDDNFVLEFKDKNNNLFHL